MGRKGSKDFVVKTQLFKTMSYQGKKAAPEPRP